MMKGVSKSSSKRFVFLLVGILASGYGAKAVFAQISPSVLYVPLIGITSVPDPFALPNGPHSVTYHYAVKNFIQEIPLTDVRVIDDHCSPVSFTGGDDNGNGKLDYSETWRYSCTTNVSVTTQSIATATGVANAITAAHSANTTVVVGSNNPAPLVSIVNITKVAYPLSLPAGGGPINFTYKVNNPGIVPLSDVTVSDDHCSAMSGALGDTNDNKLLDTNEVWIYSCTANLTQTTTSTVSVTAFANGLKAFDSVTINVNVTMLIATSSPNLFDVSVGPGATANPDFKITVWEILSAVLAALIIIFVFVRKRGPGKMP